MTKQAKSNIIFIFKDLLGAPIQGVRYHVKENGRLISDGLTNGKGESVELIKNLGAHLNVYIKLIYSDEMKEIGEIVLRHSKMLVTLTSPKLLVDLNFIEHQGSSGGYKRKTHIVKAGETLSGIASKNGTTVRELVRLNKLHSAELINVDQVLKLPLMTKSVNSARVSKSKNANSQIVKLTPVIDRSENSGSPKTTINSVCTVNSACLKKGDKGPLILELNVRLAGFGGALPTEEFTDLTEKCVRQFQRDYMGTQETGAVCGTLLVALDEFMNTYSMAKYFPQMKCHCGICSGFGQGKMNVPWYGNIANEYPGIHRSIVWALRAVQFYLQFTKIGYSILEISSGYRCIEDNRQHGNRKTVNHMGRALDVLFIKDGEKTRTGNVGIEEIRSEIFVKYLGAQYAWTEDNKISMETTALGATTWVHFDVRKFDQSLQEGFFCRTLAVVNGGAIIEVARKFNNQLAVCGGAVESRATLQVTDLDIDSLIIEIGNVISGGEGNYESYNTGTRNGRVQHSYMNPPAGTVTGKSIDEIIASHSLSAMDTHRLFAVGKYQVAGATMAASKLALKLNGDELFDSSLQEQVFKDFLLKKAGGGKLAAFVFKGEGTVDDAMYAASKEWASIAVPDGFSIKGGEIKSDGMKSYYESGMNHANKSSSKKLRDVLNKIESMRKEGELN